jgi:hypothetical protein
MTVSVPIVWPLGAAWPVEFTADKDLTLFAPPPARIDLRLKYGSVWREQAVPPDRAYIVLAGQHVRISQREATP